MDIKCLTQNKLPIINLVFRYYHFMILGQRKGKDSKN